MQMNKSVVRTVMLLLVAATAVVGCKKGGGGYIRTAPVPAVAR